MKLINGIESDVIPVTDRGLQYGDGLFETVTLQNGQPLLWDLHLSRLQRGCEHLRIEFPGRDILENDLQSLLANTNIRQWAVMKIIVTRGQGQRGYALPNPQVTTRILYLSDWPSEQLENSNKGIATVFCKTRMAPQPALAGLKHLNRLEQILARREWNDPGIKEGIMRDISGNIIEGTMSNIFLASSEGLYTPDISHTGVDGVQRQNIIRIADTCNINLTIHDINENLLSRSEEIFITNSVIGIWPVTSLGNYTYPIGKLTRQLQTYIPQCNNS